MLTLEEQIERVAEAAIAASPAPQHHRTLEVTTGSSGGPRRRLGVAAGVLVLGLLGGLVWVLSNRSSEPAPSNPAPTAPARPLGGPLPPNEPTVVADPEQMWLVPTWLPDGVTFEVAAFAEGFGAELRYVSADGEPAIEIRSDQPTSPSSAGTETVTIDGVDWTIVEATLENGSDFVQLATSSAPTSTGQVHIAGSLGREVLIDVVDQLDLRPATALPRPPLPMSPRANNGVVVAEATASGVPKQLVVATDGVYFSMSVDGGGGGPERLGDGTFIVASGASGPNPNLVADGGEAESMLWGLVHPDVASIEIELTDGTAIVTEPQDEYGFNENFFFAAFPTRTESGLEMASALVARDSNGNELERLDGLFGPPAGVETVTPSDGR